MIPYHFFVFDCVTLCGNEARKDDEVMQHRPVILLKVTYYPTKKNIYILAIGRTLQVLGGRAD